MLLNKKATYYPSWSDSNLGLSLIDPRADLTMVSNPATWSPTDRNNYKNWYNSSFPNNGIDWSYYDVHHNLPRAYGGQNNYSKPLPNWFHWTVTAWWNSY